MKRIVSLCVIIFFAMSLMAQTVTNVVAEQVGKKIEIRYQLDKQSNISIQYSTDGGSTYRSMTHTSGDVGRGIAAGQRTITWDVLADVEKLVCGNLVFRVTPGGGEKLSFTVNGVSFTMIQVEGGTFTMGATSEQGSDAECDEEPTHSVTLSTYYMGETEVTQALWWAVMGKSVTQIAIENGWSTDGVGDDYPMYDISYEDCKTFVSKLNSLLSSQLGGKRFALPTEAQWEYAARGGKKSQGYKYSGGNRLSVVAWRKNYKKIGSVTYPVKMMQANELGLYGMSGNVWEWCQDWYGSYSSSSQTNPQGSNSGSYRVSRGGGWSRSSNASACRVSSRLSCSPSDRRHILGFRLCLIP